MSKQLQPGDRVICKVKSYMTRSAVFVRYVKRVKVWPPAYRYSNPNDRSRCLVQFRHNKTPNLMDSKLVSIDRSKDPTTLSKTLEKDDDYEKVNCPDCGHTWHARKQLNSLYGHKQTVYCPECRCPLKPPAFNTALPDFSEKNSAK